MRLGLLAIVSLPACLPPVARPMRTDPGLHLAGGLTIAAGGEDEQACYEGCDREEVSSPAVYLDARYGHMLTEHFGVTVGAYPAGAATAKTTGYGALAVAYLQGSAQLPWASLALGGEVGVNMAAPIVGIDLSPWGPGWRRPALAAYVRYAVPFRDPADPMDETAEEIASLSAGATLRFAWGCAGLMYWKNERGRVELPVIVEGSAQARSWVVVFVGMDLPLR